MLACLSSGRAQKVEGRGKANMLASTWAVGILVIPLLGLHAAAGPALEFADNEKPLLQNSSKTIVEELSYLPTLSHDSKDWSTNGNILWNFTEILSDAFEPLGHIQVDYSRDRYAWDPDFSLYRPPNYIKGKTFARALRGRPSSYPYLYSGDYVAAIGAAQVYGTLAERPFTTILQEEYLKQPVINLAKGGPGSYYYATEHWDDFGHLLRNASVVLVQVMSGRSACSSIPEIIENWECSGQNTYRNRKTGVEREAAQIIKSYYNDGNEEMAVRLCQDIREQGILQYLKLFDQIKENNPINPRIILIYVSRRKIGFMDDSNYRSCVEYMKGSPVLVDKAYLQRLLAHSSVEGIVTDTEDFDLKCKLVNCSPLTEKVREKYPSAVREMQMYNSCKDSILIEMQANGARFCRPDDIRRDVTKGAPCYSEEDPGLYCSVLVYNYDYISGLTHIRLAALLNDAIQNRLYSALP